MRGVKKVALRLIETFVDKCEDTALIASQFVPPMTDPILGDYARNVPDARYGLGFLKGFRGQCYCATLARSCCP